jgi:hypothetical protein
MQISAFTIRRDCLQPCLKDGTPSKWIGKEETTSEGFENNSLTISPKIKTDGDKRGKELILRKKSRRKEKKRRRSDFTETSLIIMSGVCD